MRRFVKLVGVVLILAPVVIADRDIQTQRLAGSRPNIVFVLLDDMGWAQPGFNGGNPELTPHMDKLASQSMQLREFYTHSVCAPTRGAFLTGRYAFRNWMDWRSEDFGKPSYLKKLGLTLPKNSKGEATRRLHALSSEERTIAEALKEAGYYTSLIGKWHGGEWKSEHLPMGQGFMHQYGHYAWGIDYYTKTIVHNAPARFAVYDWHRNQKPVFEKGYATDLFAAEAERVLAQQKKDRPFFMYLPFNAVHGPIGKPPRYTDKYDARSAALKCVDDALGRIVAAIDKNGFGDNTLLIFTNDNGPLFEEMSKPFRGTKNTTFEGGVRVPILIRWPGKIKPGSQKEGMMFIADWYSTFIQLAGANPKQKTKVDGMDMTDFLFGEKPSPRKEIVFEVAGSVRLPTIRQGEYKLMGEMLYNIKKDPSEKEDVAKKHPEIVRKLKKRLEELGKERPKLVVKEIMEESLPYVYGMEENKNVPSWLKKHVDKVREGQPKTWAKGETPWPQAPVGANANKQPVGVKRVGAK